MAMSPPPPRRDPRSTPELPSDLMREIFLRVPADDPATLVRSAAGCWSWRRMISHTDFATAYRKLRGAPPMLGFLYDGRYTDYEPPHELFWISRFLPTATSPRRPLAAQVWKHWHVLDSRHGLVLFYTPRVDDDFVVCDLVTGEQWVILADPKCYDIMWSNLEEDMGDDERISCNAAVLCAKDGCDHRDDCHGGPFLVVLLGSHTSWVGNQYMNHASVYSSVTREWSDVTSIEQENVINGWGHSAVVGNNVYVPCVEDDSVVVYNIRENELSVIAMPFNDESQPYVDLMGVEDGMLLFASVVKPRLYLWSMEAGPRGAAGWARRRVIELGPLLPLPVLEDNLAVSPVGYVEGVGLIFIRTRVGLYKMELSSAQGGQVHGVYTKKVMPYMSFYTGVWKSLPASDEASHAVADATTT